MTNKPMTNTLITNTLITNSLYNELTYNEYVLTALVTTQTAPGHDFSQSSWIGMWRVFDFRKQYFRKQDF